MIRVFSLLCVVVLGFDGLLDAQPVPVARTQVTFKFVRPVTGVPVPRYTIQMLGDGSGVYHAELAAAGDAVPGAMVDRQLHFLPSTVQAVFDAVRLLRASHTPCETRLKNIADTGAKIIEYNDAEGEGVCSYNYSENKGVMRLTGIFQGIEQTLEAGRALEFKHRYDRLGLDAEMITLGASVDSGRALALETIVPALRSIAADTELIERVRLRAAKLVERTAETR